MPPRQETRTDPPYGAPAADPRPPGAVHSMTGYAHETAETDCGRLTLELRSVNSRFTDLHFRLGDEVRGLEPRLRETLATVLRRGKVECRMSLRALDADGDRLRIDEAMVARLADLDARIRALAPAAAPLSVADYLRWGNGHGAGGHDPDPATAAGADGVRSDGSADGSGDGSGDEGSGVGSAGPTEEPGAERLWQAARPLVERVVAAFVDSRAREGARLAATIAAQVDGMAAIVADIRPAVPELLETARQKLTTRLQDAMADVQSAVPAEETFARIRQEIALMSLRGDVTEELDRLGIHFAAVRGALATGGAVGKRLDFLTQELNREANTIASKAAGIAVTDAAVALKLLIEQMREQVQNLE